MKRRLDAEIISKLEGDDDKEKDETLTYLYQKMYPMVKRFILQNNGTTLDTEDIFQDGLLAFYKLVRRGKISHDTNVEAYVFSICRNLWLKQIGKRSNTLEIKDELLDIPTEDVRLNKLMEEDQRAIIDAILTQLGADCKQVLHYYYYERKKLKEIVHLMHYTNEQVVKNKKSKCMKKLRVLVDERPALKNILRKF